jgi:hypothetical protein
VFAGRQVNSEEHEVLHVAPGLMMSSPSQLQGTHRADRKAWKLSALFRTRYQTFTVEAR